jgi:hypothetical protein
MNCSSFKLSNPVLNWRDKPALCLEARMLSYIRQLLANRAIDLSELNKAISAVPRVALRLCQMMNDTGAEDVNVSDAVVLAGRAGIRRLLDECDKSNPPVKQQRLEWATTEITGLVKL